MRTIQRSRLSYAASLVACMSLAACYHSTQLAGTWRDPNAGPIHFAHPIAVFATTSETFRRMMEDKIAAQD